MMEAHMMIMMMMMFMKKTIVMLMKKRMVLERSKTATQRQQPLHLQCSLTH